jgi:putative MATE family efflux protein
MQRAAPSPRPGIVKRDWTQGNLFKNLLLFSWPMTVSQLLMSLGPTIDMIWVGKLGDLAVAAVGVSGVVVQLAMSVMMGFTMGMLALISRAIGANDMQGANRVAQQAVVLTAFNAVVMALVGIFFGEHIIRLVSKDPEIVRLGTAYLRIEFIGGSTIVFRMMMDTIMQSSGDTYNPMWNAFIYRAFHIVLCPMLVFGLWIFPELGVRGAAFSSVIAQSIGVFLGLRVLLSDRSRLKITFKDFKLDFGILWRIVRVGFPASIAGIQRGLSQFLIQIFIGPFGQVALAAHVIAQRIEMFLLMPAMSFGGGAGVMVGQNLGAKKPERAEKSAWIAVWFVEAILVVVGIVVFIWTGPVVRIFNSEAAVVLTTTQFIRIAIAGWVFMGFGFVLMNCLQSAGDTTASLIIQIIATWVVGILPCWLLPKYTDWGISSIRWAMTANVSVMAIANIIYFRTGRWKTRRV